MSSHIRRKFLARRAVSFGLGFFACVAMYAQAPAGPNRPLAVPDNYVVTPFGYFHPSCVLRLAEGDTLLESGPAIQHANGATEPVAACTFPRYTARGVLVTGVEPPEIGHSWIEAANITTTAAYGLLNATWIVPPAPSSNHGQTIYMFPGLEDINDVVSIIQPVLGWNADFSAAWGIASWNCCPSGITVESSPVLVSSGDKITGTMRSTCAAGTLSCPTWKVTTTDATTAHSTVLNKTPAEGQTFNWAFAGALEVYSVADCTDYPSSNSEAFSSLVLEDYNFARITNPGWVMSYWDSGLSPQCGYSGVVAARQITLDF